MMQQLLREFQKLMQQTNPFTVLGHIKAAIDNGTAEILKKILIIARYYNNGFSENIIEYSISRHANELYDFLKENSWLVPKQFFVKTSHQGLLLEYAVTHNNYYVIQNRIQDLQDKTIMISLLYLAAVKKDHAMLQLLLYYGTPVESQSLAQKCNFHQRAYIDTQSEIVRKFQTNLFTFFKASQCDSRSSIYGVPTDCIRAIQHKVVLTASNRYGHFNSNPENDQKTDIISDKCNLDNILSTSPFSNPVE